ncbi:transcription factor A, mitochondrial [Cololabis saira]|uniref:transcription factor A, mitochondrial n=1 Tax=Cololabis saira TaxID=129043 RepID=UPI002AD518D9|nr:transcription factor A, mitochondrial [Cololabis saira]
MAPAALLARSLCALSCRSALTSCTGIFSRLTAGPVQFQFQFLTPQTSVQFLTPQTSVPVQFLTSQTAGPPKRPLNGYMRYVLQQKPSVMRENPDIKVVDIIRKIAHQWRLLSPEQKQPFQDASLRERERFKLDLQRYQAQLSPDQILQQNQERRRRLEKRRNIRKKRELSSLGKPKRPRSAFNIYMSEHFEEARGSSTQGKMKSLMEDWRNLFSHQKKVYTQLAEDDKIRYKNEMKSWEEHMLEIGREDLVREKSRVHKKPAAAATRAAKKKPKSAAATAVKKSAATAVKKSAAAARTTKATGKKSSSAKTSAAKGSTKKS